MSSFVRKHYNSLVLLSALFFLVVNKSVLFDLYRKWYAQGLTSPYAYGFPVAIIVIYVAVRKIIELRLELRPVASMLGMFLLAGSQLFMFFAELLDVNFVQHLAIISTTICIIWAAYSFRIAKHFVVPALLLLFTLPIWGVIEPPLQQISIFTTNAILAVTGIPYYLDGTYFHFSSGVIQIAPECSGMAQMLVSMVIGLLFSIQFRLRLRDTIKTLLYLAITAIIINTIRIIIIMIVGYYTKMESSLVTKHILLGWVIYGIGVFAFLYFYSGRKFVQQASNANESAHTVNGGKVNAHLSMLFLFLTVMLIFPAVSNQMLVHAINNREVKFVGFDQKDTKWQKQSSRALINWRPDYPPGDAHYTATFSNEGNDIYVYINDYHSIKKNIEPVNMDNRAYRPDKWHLSKHTLEKIQIDHGLSGYVALDVVNSATSQPLLIMSFYLINGKMSVKLVKSKIYIMFGLLRGRYDIKQVNLATPIQPDTGIGKEVTRLKHFLKTMRLDD